MNTAGAVLNDFISELLSNTAGPLTSIALLAGGAWLYGGLATLVLNQQIKEHQELDQGFGSEVRVLAAFYADCAAVLSNGIVVSAATIWNLLFMVEIKSLKLLLFAVWVYIIVRLGRLLLRLTTPQDLSVYLPDATGGIKGELWAEQLRITLQSLTIPLALALLKIPGVAVWLKGLWP